MTLEQGVRDGNRTQLARAITLVESTTPEDRAAAQELLQRLMPQTGGAVRIGLSRVLSVEPEFLYLRESSDHQDYSFQTALTWEFLRRPGLRPYLVAGAGVLHSRFEFPGAQRERFSSNEFTGGYAREQAGVEGQ